MVTVSRSGENLTKPQNEQGSRPIRYRLRKPIRRNSRAPPTLAKVGCMPEFITPKDIKAMNRALDEKRTVKVAMHGASIRKAELAVAISQRIEKDRIYNEMGEKFFKRWPKRS
jgi:hypothetical protein